MQRVMRRDLLGTLLALSFFSDAFAAEKFIAYVGTYTTGEYATDEAGKGIYAYRYDAGSGELSPLGLAATATNPSFLAVDPGQRFLYAVNETVTYQGQASGGVSAFAIDSRTGKLTFLNEVSSGGADPCYLSLDKTGKFVLVANYGGGSVAAFAVLPTGRLGKSSAFVQHTRTEPNHGRQEEQAEPHAHWLEVTTDNRYAVAVDLGLNELLVYRFDAGRGSLTPNVPHSTAIEAGAGPRHFAFHSNGRFAYVVSELSSTVSVLLYDSKRGTLRPVQSLSTLPANFVGSNSTAEIAVDPTGRFVYASNRGLDSIAVFAVDAKRGTLTLIENVPTGGKTPRSFEIDPTGTRLFVANQDSGNIVVFRIDSATGHLTPSGTVLKVPSPVCIKFVAVRRP